MAKKKNAAQKAAAAQDGQPPASSTSFEPTTMEASASNNPLDALNSRDASDETARVISKVSAKLKASRVDILAASAAMTERDAIKVNKWSVPELKNACDDALRRVCGVLHNNSWAQLLTFLLRGASLRVSCSYSHNRGYFKRTTCTLT